MKNDHNYGYFADLSKLALKTYNYCHLTGIFNFKKTINKIANTKDKKGYIRISFNGKTILAHRLAWFMHYGEWPKNQIDHIDGNKSNNSIKNLRDVSCALNAQNKYKANKQNKLNILNIRKRYDNHQYQVRITCFKKEFYIGQYNSLADSILARDIARMFLKMTIPENNYVNG